jgi:hypothetical protein
MTTAFLQARGMAIARTENYSYVPRRNANSSKGKDTLDNEIAITTPMRTVASNTPPSFNVPDRSCDAHFHVFEAGYSHVPKPLYTFPEATVDQYLALVEFLGIERMVLIQPTFYGTDNSLTLDTLKKIGSRLPCCGAGGRRHSGRRTRKVRGGGDGEGGFRVLSGDEAPLVPTLLFHEPDRSIFIIAAHHSISDGMSMTVILRDLIRAGRVKLLIATRCSARKRWRLESLGHPRLPLLTLNRLLPAGPPLVLREGDTEPPAIESLRLDSDLTARLAERVPVEGTTVPGAICSACMTPGRSRSVKSPQVSR